MNLAKIVLFGLIAAVINCSYAAILGEPKRYKAIRCPLWIPTATKEETSNPSLRDRERRNSFISSDKIRLLVNPRAKSTFLNKVARCERTYYYHKPGDGLATVTEKISPWRVMKKSKWFRFHSKKYRSLKKKLVKVEYKVIPESPNNHVFTFIHFENPRNDVNWKTYSPGLDRAHCKIVSKYLFNKKLEKMLSPKLFVD